MGLWERANANNGNGSDPKSPEIIIKNIHNNELTVTLTIDKDIPIPPKGRGWSNASPFTLVLMEMEKGDSILIPSKIARQMRNALIYMRRTHPKKSFKTRKTQQGDGSFRIWRS